MDWETVQNLMNLLKEKQLVGLLDQALLNQALLNQALGKNDTE